MRKCSTDSREMLLVSLLDYVKQETCAEYELEYRFHPTRRWRFDAAFPSVKVALEVEGGLWQYGRHNRAAGFLRDCEKYNEAAALGWRIIRAPWRWIEDGTIIRQVINAVEHGKN